MTFFVFQRAKSHEWTFCDPSKGKVMRLRKSGKKECRTLTMSGELTVRHAAKLKRALTGELKRADNLQLRFGDVEEADITLLQLLCAAHKSAREIGKGLTLYENGFPPVIWNTANSAGMFGNLRCPDSGSCMYAEEKAARKGGVTK